MRYFKERQNKQKFKQYMRTLGKNNGFTQEDMSPYQKAMLKEEARRKFQLLQKNECITQRAFKNFQSSLKAFGSTYSTGDTTMNYCQRHAYRDSAVSTDEDKMKNQRQFLTIKGERKNIETDATLITTKKQYLEKLEYNMLKIKNRKNAMNIPMETSNYKNVSSKKEIVYKDNIPSYGKRTLSSQKVNKKSKMRNTNMGTFEGTAKNQIEHAPRLSEGDRLDRTKSEASNLNKDPMNDKLVSDNRLTDKNTANRGFRRFQPRRAATIFTSPETDWVKEQENRLILRKKATERYNIISANFKTNAQNETLKYIIMKGNNSDIIRRCMDLRPGWEETADFNTMFNFRWQQFSKGIKFDQLSINGKRQMVSHFPYHAAITTKDNLFKNLNEYLDTKVFDFVPLTFCLESHSENYNKDMNNFKAIFKAFQQCTEAGLTQDSRDKLSEDINLKYLQHFSQKKASRVKSLTPLVIPETHFDGYNFWFLKVTKLNRGRGIYVFDTLDKLISLIKELEEGVVLPSPNDAVNTSADIPKEKTDNTFSNISSVPNKIQSSTFVIQKYIERPLLINQRKFDIRVWVLLTQELKLYFFKEGYLRTSCEDFSLKSEDVCKTFVHLTNNAVQKHSDNYGQFEDGNQVSFQEFQNYLDSNTSEEVSVRNKIIPDMQEIIKTTYKCAENLFAKDHKKS